MFILLFFFFLHKLQITEITDFFKFYIIHFYFSAESKPSQPVSRSGSDRRPDSVREETFKSSDGGTNLEHGASKQDNDATIPDK